MNRSVKNEDLTFSFYAEGRKNTGLWGGRRATGAFNRNWINR